MVSHRGGFVYFLGMYIVVWIGNWHKALGSGFYAPRHVGLAWPGPVLITALSRRTVPYSVNPTKVVMARPGQAIPGREESIGGS